jgi:hypothetical protein
MDSLYNYINKTHLDKFSIYAIGGAIYYPLKNIWSYGTIMCWYYSLCLLLSAQLSLYATFNTFYHSIS